MRAKAEKRLVRNLCIAGLSALLSTSALAGFKPIPALPNVTVEVIKPPATTSSTTASNSSATSSQGAATSPTLPTLPVTQNQVATAKEVYQCASNSAQCQQEQVKNAQQEVAKALQASNYMTETQAQNLVKDCTTVSGCQQILNKNIEGKAALELVQAGVPADMAKGLAQGCATSTITSCDAVVQKEGTKYVTDRTSQLAAEQWGLKEDISKRVTQQCIQGGDQCTAEMQAQLKNQAINELSQKAGISTGAARELLECGSDMSKCASQMANAAQDKIKREAQAQLNNVVNSGLESIGLGGYSLSSIMNAGAMINAMIGQFTNDDGSRIASLVGLNGRYSPNVIRRDAQNLYNQANDYNPANPKNPKDIFVYYGNNNKDLSATIKTINPVIPTSVNDLQALAKSGGIPTSINDIKNVSVVIPVQVPSSITTTPKTPNG